MFTNPVEERKDKDTMNQSNFLRKYADVQSEDREYYNNMIQSKFLIKPGDKRKGKDTTDQIFFAQSLQMR